MRAYYRLMPQEHIKKLRDSLAEAADAGEVHAGELLAHMDADEEPTDGLIERFREASLRWQSSHPELSRLVGRVADLLSAEGI